MWLSSRSVTRSRAARNIHCSFACVRKRHPFLQAQARGLVIGAQAGFQPTHPPRAPVCRTEPAGPCAALPHLSSPLWAPKGPLELIHLCISPEQKSGPAVILCKRLYKLKWIVCGLGAYARLLPTWVIKCCELQEAPRAAEAGGIMSSVLFSMDSGYFNICNCKLFRALRLK